MINSLNKSKFNRQLLIGIFLVILGLMFSFYVSSINTSDAAIWLVACALGFTLQKSRFCFASSFRDLFLFGSGQNMKGILIALAVSSIGFIGILSWILPNPLPGEFPSSAHVLPVGFGCPSIGFRVRQHPFTGKLHRTCTNEKKRWASEIAGPPGNVYGSL